MARHVKKGDMVEVIAGEEKGKTGRILRLNPDKNCVVIEGLNRRYKHVRPSQKHPQGGRIQVEQPIHFSNVLPLSTKTSKGTRVHFETNEKGVKKKIGVDGTEIGIVVRK